MKRREFIGLLGAAAIGNSSAVIAQQKVPAIGLLSSISLDERDLIGFRRGLAEFGYVPGQSLQMEYRHANGSFDRLSKLAAELVSLPLKVLIAVPNAPAVSALKHATSTIPIVFLFGADPVRLGFVESLNRPGGNLTGVLLISDELTSKRFELLSRMLPPAAPIAFLTNPSNRNVDDVLGNARGAARAVGRELIVVGATNNSEIEAAFEMMRDQGAGGLVVWQEAYLTQESKRIAELAARFAIPAIYGPRAFPEVGGLMSYGANREDLFRLTGVYAAKILQGAKPNDLPVLRPSKFELVINLRTAKQLGLTVPATLLATADEVIE
jgi:putative tryptophan/tyrosine transport system substrate-binding protein